MLSTSFSIRNGVVLLAVFICLSGTAAQNDALADGIDATLTGGKRLKIAIFPVYNLSGNPAPLARIHQLLSEKIKHLGVFIIDEEVLDGVFSKHRIRYIGGLDLRSATAIRQETAADAVLITSLELYYDVAPPRIALICRLISTADPIQILWIDGVGLAGDDSPGILELSLVENPDKLMEMALQRILSSLTGFLSGQRHPVDFGKPGKRFRPKIIFRSPILSPDLNTTVAVVPFFNLSQRSFAGEIMALHFIKQLRDLGNFNVIEPGVIRQTLLKGRIIMGDGISLAHADIISGLLKADLILNGKIMDYQDFQGPAGRAKVDFSAQLFESHSRQVVWAIQSFNQGDDGVFFFDWGRMATAHAMTAQMVRLAVETIVQ